MKETKVVYSITGIGEKCYWTQVGIASENKDGSIGVLLNAVPLSGRLQIRKRKPRTAKEDIPHGE